MTIRGSRLQVIVILFLALASVVPSVGLAREKELTIPRDAVPARYVENIDGDTIIVEMANRSGNQREYKVRMIGIDTPETNYS